MSDKSGPVYARIAVELVVEITDRGQLEHAALAAVDQRERDLMPAGGAASAGPGPTEIDRERAAIISDVIEALYAVVDPDRMTSDAPGVEPKSGVAGIDLCNSAGVVHSAEPDFSTLFAACTCGRPGCASCGGWQLTPRTASLLATAGELLADQGFDDVEAHGDDPVTVDDADWDLFVEYPRLTWRQDAVWRRQAARAYDDLVADLAGGQLPSPRSVGEEMAMTLMLRLAEAMVAENWGVISELLAEHPAHPDDFAWPAAKLALFGNHRDHDLAQLFDASPGGIEDPDNEQSRRPELGGYRPGTWFSFFAEADPRDGRRPFRR
ncbi:MAG TPA: hypothetical protein VK816_06615 [Jatrophihabitantaceae bacterium]|nr:hypothetical protein [Jatrophihabitantaceae bacterium]